MYYSGLVNYSGLVYSNILSSVANLCILDVFFSRTNCHWLISGRDTLSRVFDDWFLISFLVLVQILLIVCRFFRLDSYNPITTNRVDEVVLVHDGPIALAARLCARLAGSIVGREGGNWHIKLAIFTKLGFMFTLLFMVFIVANREFFGTVFAFLFFMIFFLMIFFEVDVKHLLADRTFLDISSAVTKVSCNFRLREVLEAIIASFNWLIIHSLEIF